MPADSWPITASLPAWISPSCAAQRGLGANALGDPRRATGRWPPRGRRCVQKPCAQLVVRLLQRFARRQTVAQMTTALIDHRRQDAQQDRRDSGHRGADRAHSGDLFERREDGQRPRAAGEWLRLRQELTGYRIDRDHLLLVFGHTY